MERSVKAREKEPARKMTPQPRQAEADLLKGRPAGSGPARQGGRAPAPGPGGQKAGGGEGRGGRPRLPEGTGLVPDSRWLTGREAGSSCQASSDVPPPHEPLERPASRQPDQEEQNPPAPPPRTSEARWEQWPRQSEACSAGRSPGEKASVVPESSQSGPEGLGFQGSA